MSEPVIGQCEMCGCAIAIGHYAHCSRYKPAVSDANAREVAERTMSFCGGTLNGGALSSMHDQRLLAAAYLRSEERVERLEGALRMLVDEKCDYMRINNLGDPETQHTVKAARAALWDA